jgi:hypothetical protein
MVAVACSHQPSDGVPRLRRTTTGTTLPPEPTTVPVDLSAVALAGVPGRTVTTMRIEPGNAAITGVVTGPQGPAAGATVHAERLVGDAVVAKDVLTGADGGFTIANIVGGRYRVRAFQPSPANLAQTDPALLFLGSTETKTLNLHVDQFSGTALAFALAPSQLFVGAVANLVVQVTNRSVDPKGVVSGVPAPQSKVQMVPAPGLAVDTVNPGLTDSAGRAAFGFHCTGPGTPGMAAVVDDAVTFPLAMPPCNPEPVVAPPPTTPPTFPPLTPVSPNTTTTLFFIRPATTFRFPTPSFPTPTRR